MSSVPGGASQLLQSTIGALLWVAVKLEELRRRLPRLERRLRKSLRRLFDAWRTDVGAPVAGVRGHRAWNRTPRGRSIRGC